MKFATLKFDRVMENEQLFNSGPHQPDALLGTLPALGIQKPADERLMSYALWHSYFLETQHLEPNHVKMVYLDPDYSELLIRASKSAKITRKIPEWTKEDLCEPGIFNHLFKPPLRQRNGYLLRFDTCSTKDGVNGHRPLKTPLDVIEHIVTSHRAISSIGDCLRDWQPIRLFFIPFDRTFDKKHQYRCFSAPISAICKQPKLTAVSQYEWNSRWRERWNFTRSSESHVEHLVEKARGYQQGILEHADTFASDVAKGLREQGFVFDMRCLRSGEVQLVDINPFGITGGTRSALFHWILDAELLYGGKEDVEVRVTY